jgi:hypothetical protein
MAQNILLCFTNICAEIFLPILVFSFWTQRHILADFSKMLLSLKASKIRGAKGAMLCRRKCW